MSELNKCYIIKDEDYSEYAGAVVIQLNGRGKITHVRLLTGEHAGEVRTLGHFKCVEEARREELPILLKAVWEE